jgi:hypothetical protein
VLGALALCVAAAVQRTGASTVPADAPRAPRWTRVAAPSAAGCTFYVDPASVVTREGHEEAWFMSSCAEPQPSSSAGGPGYRSRAFLEYFDCAARTSAIVRLDYYAGELATGAVTESHDWSKPPRYEQDPPNSTGALWLAMVCRGLVGQQGPK